MPGDVVKGSVFYASWLFIVIGVLVLLTGNVGTALAVLVVSGGTLYWSSDGQPLGGRVLGG